MPVSLVQWRAVIGISNCRNSAISYHASDLTQHFVSMIDVLLYCWNYFASTFIFLLTVVYILIILQCHGDIEPNTGARILKVNSFSLCHWNLNSLSAYNFSRLIQLKVYNSIYKYDFICLLEIYWILQFLIILMI